MAISFIRILILYLTIIICLRLMGKRQINQLQPSELVVTLIISDVAAIPIQNSEQPIISGIIPILILVSFEIIVSALMVKNSKIRKLVCGGPIVVINDGNVDQKEMKRLRMTIDDLTEELRQMSVFSIEDVAYAIVETNGKLSVMKKPYKQEPDCSMLSLSVPDKGIDAVVISDGELSDFSINMCGLTKEWVEGVLKGQGKKLEDIFIMTANKNKDFYIVEKEAKS